ncbi:MAG: PEP-CTERM sorting domain-containing protein [Leptospirillum sp.]
MIRSKKKKMTKATLVVGMALAAVTGFGVLAPSAQADYLAPPTIVSPTNPNSFVATYSTNTGNSFSLNYVTTSTFGNTIPVASSVPIPSGEGTSIGSVTDSGLPASALYFNGSSLDLTQIASMKSNYTAQDGSIGTISGQVISNVLKVGSGNTMNGAKPGELVFTYQFDITSVKPSSSGLSVSQASIALFNNPGGSQLWTLGSGINVNASGTPTPLGSTLSCSGCTVLSLTGLKGLVFYDLSNETISNLEDQFSVGATNDYISPQFFVASNATNFGIGSLSLEGTGISDNVSVFVPDTPEPSTLLLLGSGLALVSFMAFRKKSDTLAI